MMIGLPIVATRAGSIPEVAADAAVLVDVDDVDGLATAIGSVLTDDALRSGLVAAGARRRDELTWTATADGLVGLYRALATGGRR